MVKFTTRDMAIKTLLGGGIVVLLGHFVSHTVHHNFSQIIIFLGYLIMTTGIVLILLVAIKENDNK